LTNAFAPYLNQRLALLNRFRTSKRTQNDSSEGLKAARLMWWWAPTKLAGKGTQLRATRPAGVDEKQRFRCQQKQKKIKALRKDVERAHALGHTVSRASP